MSLDVRLYRKGPIQKNCDCCGSTYEATNEECYWANITHNLGKMAREAGIYEALWRPEEIGIKTAGELINPLSDGLMKMKADPEKYKAFNAENGWGKYEHFVPFVQDYLDACIASPDALVSVSR